MLLVVILDGVENILHFKKKEKNRTKQSLFIFSRSK
jgi:hypothetical protein